MISVTMNTIKAYTRSLLKRDVKAILPMRWLLITFISFIVALALSKSIYIGFALLTLLLAIGLIRSTAESVRISSKLDEVWPEAIDHLIAGIQSGMSLTESFMGLEERGPLQLRPLIASLVPGLKSHGNFEKSLDELKGYVASPACDQICEAIAISRSLGGSELIYVLRTLGDFLRVDLATRKEIEVKHGWIKNSAHLSAVAPWLLLLLLSTQPGTAEAFSTPTGILILIAGVLATCIAYLWMNLLSKLPRAPRVFVVQSHKVGSSL